MKVSIILFWRQEPTKWWFFILNRETEIFKIYGLHLFIFEFNCEIVFSIYGFLLVEIFLFVVELVNFHVDHQQFHAFVRT